jgi:hypothetical protein
VKILLSVALHALKRHVNRSPQTRVFARTLFSNVDLVFARDRYSKEYELMGAGFRMIADRNLLSAEVGSLEI